MGRSVRNFSQKDPIGIGNHMEANMSEVENLSAGQKIEKIRARRLEACPRSSKRLLASCWAKKASPRAAIKAFCAECVGYDRLAVTECTAYACPLWRYRPHQKAQDPLS
jgi:hypothetical protein